MVVQKVDFFLALKFSVIHNVRAQEKFQNVKIYEMNILAKKGLLQILERIGEVAVGKCPIEIVALKSFYNFLGTELKISLFLVRLLSTNPEYCSSVQMVST